MKPARTTNHRTQYKSPIAESRAGAILTIDIGGTKIKTLVSGQTEPRKTVSGKDLTPARMVEVVQKLTEDWDYKAVSIGYPGQVGENGPRSEPGNLGTGWVGLMGRLRLCFCLWPSCPDHQRRCYAGTGQL
jgi:hypothetical protein